MTAKSADRTAHGAQDAAVVAARSATQGPRRDPAAHPRRQQPRQPAPHLRPETRIRAIPALIRPAAQAQVPVEPAVMAAIVQVPRAMPAATAPPPAGPVPATPQAGPAVNNPLTPICVCRRSDPRECRQTRLSTLGAVPVSVDGWIWHARNPGMLSGRHCTNRRQFPSRTTWARPPYYDGGRAHVLYP